MDLPKDYYLGQLYTIIPTDEKMKSLAIYIRAFREDTSLILKGLEFVYFNSSIHHRLSLYYLVNEIISGEKSHTTIKLMADLKIFLKNHFISDKEAAIEHPTIYNKFVALQAIWKKKDVMDFDEKFSAEGIVSKVYSTFNDKNKLAEFLEAVSSHYKSHGSGSNNS